MHDALTVDATPRLTFRQLTGERDEGEFRSILRDQYEALGFLGRGKDPDATLPRRGFLPRADTRLYGLSDEEGLTAICSLNQVTDVDSVFHRYVPPLLDDPACVAMELNTVVVRKRARGGRALTILLMRALDEALRFGAGCVCGIVRYEVLSHFVQIGAMPVRHPPLKILEDRDYEDFIIYFDCSSEAAVEYLRYHAEQLQRREVVLTQIRKERAGRRARITH